MIYSFFMMERKFSNNHIWTIFALNDWNISWNIGLFIWKCYYYCFSYKCKNFIYVFVVLIMIQDLVWFSDSFSFTTKRTLNIEAPELKWVNPILDIIGVNSLRLVGLLLFLSNVHYIVYFYFLNSLELL